MRKTILRLMILGLPVLGPASAGEVVDRIVAVVGKEIITLSELQEYRKGAAKEPLEGLIRERLFAAEMERLGISASDDDLADALRQVLSRNRMTPEQLRSELSRKGTSFDRYKAELRQEIRRYKFLGQVIVPRIRVSEEEIAKQAGPNATEEARLIARQKIVESRLTGELESYLDEVRHKTYVEIKK